MVRFICWSLAIALSVGFGPSLVSLTKGMAQAAIHAHMHDQMSYSKFTHTLLRAKPRPTPQKQ